MNLSLTLSSINQFIICPRKNPSSCWVWGKSFQTSTKCFLSTLNEETDCSKDIFSKLICTFISYRSQFFFFNLTVSLLVIFHIDATVILFHIDCKYFFTKLILQKNIYHKAKNYKLLIMFNANAIPVKNHLRNHCKNQRN